MTKATAQDRRATTRDQILEATLETLREEGFAGATSRAIARRGGFNQALVFYYFGSLDGLLLAALDLTSNRRLERYRDALAAVSGLEQMVQTAAELYREDRESGHMTVVSQLVSGSLARRELAPQVLACMEPWLEFARETIERAVAGTPLAGLVPVEEAASAVITFYLGVNLLSNLDGGGRTDALFAHLDTVAPLARMLEGGT
jgi:AcrR family transcriptional regulator